MARPTKYKQEYCRIAYQMALLGATDKDMAKAFDTTEQTINNWKKNSEFFESLKKGKLHADAEIADRLFQRAQGYEHKDLYIAQYQGCIVKEEIIKHYPPDSTAAIFWLKNRQPDRWREKQTTVHELSDKGTFNITFRNGDSDPNKTTNVQSDKPKSD